MVSDKGGLDGLAKTRTRIYVSLALHNSSRETLNGERLKNKSYPIVKSTMSSEVKEVKLIKRRGHHVIYDDPDFRPAAFLEGLVDKKYGLQAGFTKRLGSTVHILVVFKNKPSFENYNAISSYFEFESCEPFSVGKISSSKTHFNAMLADVNERLGGSPEHTHNFKERIQNPRAFIMRKIRLGLTLNGLRELLFSDVPEELFAELLRNYEDYREYIIRFETIKLIEL